MQTFTLKKKKKSIKHITFKQYIIFFRPNLMIIFESPVHILLFLWPRLTYELCLFWTIITPGQTHGVQPTVLCYVIDVRWITFCVINHDLNCWEVQLKSSLLWSYFQIYFKLFIMVVKKFVILDISWIVDVSLWEKIHLTRYYSEENTH
jgi:hypothetical protein